MDGGNGEVEYKLGGMKVRVGKSELEGKEAEGGYSPPPRAVPPPSSSLVHSPAGSSVASTHAQ